MNYTQEPWEIQNGSTGSYIIAKDGNGNHVTVAQIFSRGVASCETMGNARLVKAAPKMYEKLKELNEWLSDLEITNLLAEVEGKGDEDASSK